MGIFIDPPKGWSFSHNPIYGGTKYQCELKFDGNLVARAVTDSSWHVISQTEMLDFKGDAAVSAVVERVFQANLEDLRKQRDEEEQRRRRENEQAERRARLEKEGLRTNILKAGGAA